MKSSIAKLVPTWHDGGSGISNGRHEMEIDDPRPCIFGFHSFEVSRHEAAGLLRLLHIPVGRFSHAVSDTFGTTLNTICMSAIQF